LRLPAKCSAFPSSASGTKKRAAARLVRERKLKHLGATAQHPPGERCVIRIGLEGQHAVGDFRQSKCVDALIGPDIDGCAAAPDE
jgi:hypothetical protein